jgi:hypothetical protein
MSMSCWLLGVTPAQIEALRKTPATAAVVARGDFRDPRVTLLGRFEKPLGLGKSWHILHWLFTGHADAAPAPGDALMTGEAIGPSMNYGPVRLHTPEETRAFAGFLAALDEARLEQRVNVGQMQDAGVSGLPMGGGDDPSAVEEVRVAVRAYFPSLAAYVAQMAGKGDGLLVWMA